MALWKNVRGHKERDSFSLPSMNKGWCGSNSFASCFAIPLCTLPWKSTPTPNSRARTSLTRVGGSIQAAASAYTDHFLLVKLIRVRHTTPVHLNFCEPLLETTHGSRHDFTRIVSAHPSVHSDAIAHFFSKQLPHRNSQLIPNNAISKPDKAL
jgi:hypothetical protein